MKNYKKEITTNEGIILAYSLLLENYLMENTFFFFFTKARLGTLLINFKVCSLYKIIL